jgi:molybdate transport system substrate-binding protein
MRCMSRLFCALVLTFIASAANAAEVRVMISAGFYGVYEQMAPAFERTTGHKLVTSRGPTMGDSPEAIPNRLTRGESADVVIGDGRGAEDLAKRDFILPETWIDFAKSKVGMVVREGAPKPDISTVDALKATLLAAKSVAYSDSTSGSYLSTTGELLKFLSSKEAAPVITKAGLAPIAH